jgi:peptidoglycan endopeptidase LytE
MIVAAVAALIAVLPASTSHADQPPIPPGAETYTVQVGDTLFDIARRSGDSVDNIIQLNQLSDPDQLIVGTVIRLHAATHTASGPLVAIGSAPQQMSGQPTGGQTIGGTVQGALTPLMSTSPMVSAPGAGPRLSGPPPASAAPLGASITASPPATRTNLMVSPATAAALVAPIDPGTVTAAHLAPPASVQIALQYAGAPYVFGGTQPSGFDCSGFVQFVMSRAGKVIPRDLASQYDAGTHPSGELLPGDIVFFKNTYEDGLSHNGIYLGNLQFIHAIDEDRGVGISNLGEPYYTARWYGATRLP